MHLPPSNGHDTCENDFKSNKPCLWNNQGCTQTLHHLCLEERWEQENRV